MARDRPSPYGNPGRFLSSIRSGLGAPELRSFIGSGHGEGQALALRLDGPFFFRSAGACPPRASTYGDLLPKRTRYPH